MKKRKVTLILSFSIIFVSILAVALGVILPTLKTNKSDKNAYSNTTISKNYEQSKGNDDKSNNGNNPTTVPDETDKKSITDYVKFFVNTNAITKTKEICGETIIFKCSFKLFALNNSKEDKSFLVNGFSGKYNIGSSGKLYTFLCKDNEKSFILKPNDVKDLDFEISYVITDNENFNDNQKFDLEIDYMLEKIFSASV